MMKRRPLLLFLDGLSVNIAPFVLLLMVTSWAQGQGAPDVTAATETTVGMAGHIRELVLPGPALDAVPAEIAHPLTIRIVSVSPHGSDHRYDIDYWGLEPGTHNLAAFLRPAPGVDAVPLPEIPVRIVSVLPEGRVQPNAPPAGSLPQLGGYKTLMITAAVLWVAGLFAILLLGRPRRAAVAAANRAPTLAERLRPLVARALAGDLSRKERAELELSLVGYWQRRLASQDTGLTDANPAEVIATLRQHDEAGPLLRSLEEWLHMPEPRPEVDLDALLAPYRDLPADALDRAK